MPAGPGALGFVYFAAAKLVGYTAFCRFAIEPQFEKDDAALTAPLPNAWKAGAVRTAIGVAIGAAVGLGYWAAPWAAKHSDVVTMYFFVLLIPVRYFEWWLLLKWIYPKHELSSYRRAGVIMAGVLASFAVDALGVGAAFVLPGGIWVC
jgi:hypothetical protein